METTLCRKKAPPSNHKYFIAGCRIPPLLLGAVVRAGYMERGQDPQWLESRNAWGTTGAPGVGTSSQQERKNECPASLQDLGRKETRVSAGS